MIHILNAKTDSIRSVIHEDEFWGDVHTRKLTLEETFYFETFADRPFAEFLHDRNRVVIPNEDGGYSEFIIEETEQLIDRTVVVRSSASYVELIKQKIIEPQKLQSQTASTAMTFALTGTRWKVGKVAYSTVRSVEIEDHRDAFSVLKLIAATFDLELNFRVEVSGNKVTGRYVDLVERVGSWVGREVVFGQDLIGIKRLERTDRIVTALLGLGPAREDGTRLEVLVEDKDALERWSLDGNHLIEVYEPTSDNQDMTIGQLTSYTEIELAKRITASVEYEATIADLESIPELSQHRVRFGDTIRIKDEGFFPPLYLEARIHTQERSIKYAEEKSFVLGDYIEYSEAEVFALLASLRSQVGKAIAQREMYKGGTEPADKTKYWVDTTTVPNVLKQWDTLTDSWVKVTPTEPGEVGAPTPQEVRDMSESERYRGSRAQLFREKSTIDQRYGQVANHPQLYDGTVGNALVSKKNDLNTKYNALITAIDNATADGFITDVERAQLETLTEDYRVSKTAYEGALTNAEQAIADGKAADAEAAATDFTETYSQKKVSQGSVNPSSPVTGDLWIDTSVNPYIWKQWSGSQWVKLDRTDLSELTGKISAAQIAANIITSNMISTVGLDAGVIKFGTMSGERILTNTLDGNAIKARTLTADAIYGGSLTIGTANMFSFSDPAHNSSFSSKIVDVPYISPKSYEAPLNVSSQPKNLDIQPGETFSVSFYAKRKDGSTNSTIRVAFRFGDATGAHVATEPFSFDDVFIGSWKKYTATVVAPAGAYKLNTYFTMLAGDGTAVYVNAIMLNRGATALEYVPHTDDDINAGAITGDKIRAGTVDANVLKAGTVIANNITFTGTLSGATGTFRGRLDSAQIQITNPTYASDGFVKLVFDRMDIDPVSSGYRRTGYLDVISQFNQLVIKGRTGYGDTSFGSQAGLRVEGNVEVIGGPFKVEGSTTLNGAVDVTGRQQISAGGDAQRIMGNASAYTTFWKEYGAKRIGYVGTPTANNDNLYVYSDNGIVQLYGSCKINTMGSIARWQRTDNDYIAQTTTGQIVFYMGGTARHAFNTDGTKSGGSIEVAGVNYGMSPIDSPQVLLEYIEFGIPLSPTGTKVFVDGIYLETVEHWAAFPNNGTIIEKGVDYFVIAGEGVADIRIVGERVDYAGVFYADLAVIEEEQASTQEVPLV